VPAMLSMNSGVHSSCVICERSPAAAKAVFPHAPAIAALAE
jgi:hypothetical protein